MSLYLLRPDFGNPTSSPLRALGRLLHSQASGCPRPYMDATGLAASIASGDIVMDEIILPWRPSADESLVDRILADEGSRAESATHRLLKVHARVLALAMDPQAHLTPEAAATDERYPIRADLIAWNAYGLSQTMECGAVDGRSVLAQLRHGHLRVLVMPYVGLHRPEIYAVGFRLNSNPPPPALSAQNGVQAWEQLICRHPEIRTATKAIAA